MQRLVQHQNPEGRETPSLLLTDLRQIDPRIELVYVGQRQWWVGRVEPNAVRAEKGRLILQQMLALDDHMRDRFSIACNILLGHLLVQGFARIEAYRDKGDPSGPVEVAWFNGKVEPEWYETTILADIKERYFHFNRDGGEAKVAERMRLTDGTARDEQSDADFREYLANDGLAHYNREVRNRVTFGHDGMTGGSGKLVHL